MTRGLSDERLRVIIPDSHGSYIDEQAAECFLKDLKVINPSEIIMLGDHVDAGGFYSVHQPNYVEETTYSYEEDVNAAAKFLDEIQARAPKASITMLEGNHEQHVERALTRLQMRTRDIEMLRAIQAPAHRLRLKARGIRYCPMSLFQDGLSVRGTIRKGYCFFVHGITASKFATERHVTRFGACVVHGHTHRAQSYLTRTVTADAIGGWCPGTLAQTQPLYMHTSPTEWTHGYGLQAVARDGRFVHLNIPIIKGWSPLQILLNKIKPKRYMGR